MSIEKELEHWKKLCFSLMDLRKSQHEFIVFLLENEKKNIHIADTKDNICWGNEEWIECYCAKCMPQNYCKVCNCLLHETGTCNNCVLMEALK